MKVHIGAATIQPRFS